jgi:rSAM/selenodomain-associated transferase 1
LDRIGLFFKTPVSGQVKTRLVPPLSPEAAARLSEAFLEDAVSLCRACGDELVLFQAGSARQRLPRSLQSLVCREQRGDDLGARMDAAFQELLVESGSRALLVGSDVPTLPPARLGQAFFALEAADVVLGPAEDGGYYLVGLKRPVGGIFRNVTWGAATVLAETLAHAALLGLKVHLLDSWYDVDTGQDLERLIGDLKRVPRLGNPAPATRKALVELALLEP